MTATPTFTVDSNVVLDCFERQLQDACDVIALHPERARIQGANRTPDRETTLWASKLDTLDVGRKENFFRLDVSLIGGPDVLAGDDDVARLKELQSVVFPSGVTRASGEPELGKLFDVDILDAHVRSGADYFVTRDEHFLRVAEKLRQQFRIEVVTPADAVTKLSG